MSVYFLAGEKANILERSNVAISSSDADALFPLTRLYNGRPSEASKFGSNGADRKVTIDANLVANGDMETSTLDGWTDADTGTGASTEELTLFKNGAKAMKLDGGASGVAERYRDITVRAGERKKLDVWIRGTGDTITCRVRLLNLQTGKYLDSSQAWQTAASDATTEAGSTYLQKEIEFQIESYAICQVDTMTLRIYVRNEDNGAAYCDDLYIYPAVNLVGIFGHNLAPVLTPELRSSTDNFSASDDLQATLAITRPSLFGYLSTAIYRRYWQLDLNGTNVETPWLGELVLGYAETLTKDARPGWVLRYVRDQDRNQTPTGEAYVTGIGGARRRALVLSFRHTGPTATAQLNEIRDALYDRTNHGEFPLVIVPVHDESVVIHGRLSQELAIRRQFSDVWDVPTVMIVESPFPAVVG